MNWVWRKHTQVQRRILPLITFTLITVFAFTLAGIYSSQVSTSMGSEVLLSGSNCGIQSWDNMDVKNFVESFHPYAVQRTGSSANYAQRCYQNGASIKECSTFVRKSLPWQSKQDVACPFDEKICRSNSTNIRLDTGYLNSNFDLGINSPPEDQFLYRNVVECAPLKTEGYSKNGTRNSTTTEQVMSYYYGSAIGFSSRPTYQYPANPPSRGGYYKGNSLSAYADYTIR